MLFADLLFLHLVIFLMFFILVYSTCNYAGKYVHVQLDCDIIRPICIHLLGTGRSTA